ncbi:chromate transporter [Deinococcus sp. UYEF24]
MTTSDARPSPGQAASLGQIFNGFLRASLNAFGGGLNAHLLNLVRRQHWLPEAEFAELSTFAQTLPGSNNGNLSALLGYRLAGVPGAAAALIGLLLPGSLLMCVVAWFFFGGGLDLSSSRLGGALKGAAAAALGISAAAGLNILRHTLTRPVPAVLAFITCLLALLLHDGTLLALLVLVPLGMLLSQKEAGKQDEA